MYAHHSMAAATVQQSQVRTNLSNRCLRASRRVEPWVPVHVPPGCGGLRLSVCLRLLSLPASRCNPVGTSWDLLGGRPPSGLSAALALHPTLPARRGPARGLGEPLRLRLWLCGRAECACCACACAPPGLWGNPSAASPSWLRLSSPTLAQGPQVARLDPRSV